MDDTQFASPPTAAYGLVLTMASIGYIFLERSIIAADPANARLASAIGSDV